MLLKHQYSWQSGQLAPQTVGAAATRQVSVGALELLGRMLHFNQKFKILKKKSEFPKCLHHTLPLAPFSCYCIPWARGSERPQLI